MQWVAVLLVTVKGLCPERFTGVVPTLAGFGQQLDSDTVLRELREVALFRFRLIAPLVHLPAGLLASMLICTFSTSQNCTLFIGG